MSFTSEVWQRISPIMTAIYDHPFVTKLADGTLDEKIFNEYMVQDALYLVYYGRALAGLASQATDPEEIVFWSSCTKETVEIERQLHAAHVEKIDAGTPNPSCRAYTSYLVSLLSAGSYRVAAAGILPCFWIYSDVGDHLLAKAGDLSNHPYGDWIGTYGDPNFEAQNEHAKQIVDRLAEQACAEEKNRMFEAFIYASKYEWMFWDGAWRLEKWPV